MPLYKLSAFFIFIVINTQTWGQECPASDTLTTVNNPCTVTGSGSTFELNFNSGFTDTTAVNAVDGNPGNTIGTQRQYAFIKAAEILSNKMVSDVNIEVDANFSSLECNSNGAVLGSAGAAGWYSHPSPPNEMLPNTYHPIALYNALFGTDKAASDNDIRAEFNQNLGTNNCLQSSDGWYYGFASPSEKAIGFTTVLLHELSHGLGFASLIDPSTGGKPNNSDDVFSLFLVDKNNGPWPDLTNSERLDSSKSGDGLLWNGDNTNLKAIGVFAEGFQDNDTSGSFTQGDRIQMYAPNPIEIGSSTSHFDTALSPNELMEPSYTEGSYELGLALYLLQDLGWSILDANDNDNNNTEQNVSVDGTDFSDNDTITLDLTTKQIDVPGNPDDFQYGLVYQGENVTPLLQPNETGVSITLPESGAFAGTYTLTILNLSLIHI